MRVVPVLPRCALGTGSRRLLPCGVMTKPPRSRPSRSGKQDSTIRPNRDSATLAASGEGPSGFDSFQRRYALNASSPLPWIQA